MKLILKFNDGSISTQVIDEPKVEGDGDFLRIILNTKKENKKVTIKTNDGDIIKDGKDLYSAEIILD